MREFEQKVYEYMMEQAFFVPGSKVVVGVSGGADSVSLLCVLDALREKLGIDKGGIAVLHVHHGIRGDEADRDASFVKALSEKLGYTYYEYKEDIPTLAKKTGMTIEEAGRTYRYACMEELSEQLGFDKIAVAHNQEDVAETVLFHMIRGSGLNGLAGIQASRGKIVRPLLHMSRMEIESYLHEKGQMYCIDSTNNELAYTRNKLRHQILPVLQQINPRAVEHICELAESAQSSFQYVEVQAKHQFEQVAKHCIPGQTVVLDVEKFENIELPIQEQIIFLAISKVAQNKKDITRKHIRSVRSLVCKNTGARVQLPYRIIARKNYGQLILTLNEQSGEDYHMFIEGPGEYNIPNMGILSVESLSASDENDIQKNDYTKIINCDRIKDTLCVRTPEEDDFIVIDKQRHRKKLSRVFIDEKIDRKMRETWPVLACGNEVIWVIGLRFSPAFYVDSDTKQIMKFEYKRKGESIWSQKLK